MKDKKNGPDPLRTFELDVTEWDEIIKSVTDEGQQSWSDYAPTIVAAVQLGYMDEHLHMLAKFLRERYMHLNQGTPSPRYYATGTGPATRPAETAAVGRATVIDTSGLDMIPPGGVTPLRPAIPGSRSTRATFHAKGYVFGNSDFVGKHFQTSMNGGMLVRIDKVAQTNFQCHIVACVGKPQIVGKTYNFRIEAQRSIYNIPNA